MCGLGDLQQGKKGDRSQVILREIREEFEKSWVSLREQGVAERGG